MSHRRLSSHRRTGTRLCAGGSGVATEPAYRPARQRPHGARRAKAFWEFDVRRPKGLIDRVSCEMQLEARGSSSGGPRKAKGLRQDVLEHQREGPCDVELIKVDVVSPDHGRAVRRAKPGSDAQVACSRVPSRSARLNFDKTVSNPPEQC